MLLLQKGVKIRRKKIEANKKVEVDHKNRKKPKFGRLPYLAQWLQCHLSIDLICLHICLLFTIFNLVHIRK